MVLLDLPPVEIFALGIAKGKVNFFNKDLIILFFGNLTAIVFSFALANFETFDFFSFFKIYVRGPGENFFIKF